jgi:DNA-binding XRE family transcriptional regulator
MTVESAATVIARAVRARRIELKLSTDAAAAKARIPEKAWRVVEQGIANPSSLTVLAICRALEWSPSTIESLIQRELRLNGNGEIVVDLQEQEQADAPQPETVTPSRRAPRTLDTEGLTPDELAEVQDFIDEIRRDR